MTSLGSGQPPGLGFKDQSEAEAAFTEAEHGSLLPHNSPACLVLAELSGEKVIFSAEADWRWEDGSRAGCGGVRLGG